jgi:hypothetical protein
MSRAPTSGPAPEAVSSVSRDRLGGYNERTSLGRPLPAALCAVTFADRLDDADPGASGRKPACSAGQPLRKLHWLEPGRELNPRPTDYEPGRKPSSIQTT